VIETVRGSDAALYAITSVAPLFPMPFRAGVDEHPAIPAVAAAATARRLRRRSISVESVRSIHAG
jgi:hypothetical protein